MEKKFGVLFQLFTNFVKAVKIFILRTWNFIIFPEYPNVCFVPKLLVFLDGFRAHHQMFTVLSQSDVSDV